MFRILTFSFKVHSHLFWMQICNMKKMSLSSCVHIVFINKKCNAPTHIKSWQWRPCSCCGQFCRTPWAVKQQEKCSKMNLLAREFEMKGLHFILKQEQWKDFIITDMMDLWNVMCNVEVQLSLRTPWGQVEVGGVAPG